MTYVNRRLLNSADSSTFIINYKDGTGCDYEIRYFNNNQFNTTGGPSLTKYYKNGQLAKQVWTNKEGQCHRWDHPAVILYTKAGKIYRQVWWWNRININPIIKKLFGKIPHELLKDQLVLLKLNVPTQALIELSSL